MSMFLVFVSCVMAAFVSYCGSDDGATGPLRHHTEWLGAVAGILWLVCIVAAFAAL